MSIKDLAKHFTGSLVSLKKTSPEELMGMVQQDNKRAFEMIYNRFKHPIYNYCLQLGASEHFAEEITHEVFLKVFKNRHQYDSRYKFSTWLWTMARNTTYDHFRKKDPLKDLVDPSPDEGLDPLDRIESGGPSPEDEVIEKAQVEMLRSCLEGLPEQQKEALTLRINAGMSYQELEEVTGLSNSAIKSLLHRAKQSLTKCLKAKVES